MSLQTRMLPYSVQVKTAAPVAAWINQIESTSPEGGVTLFEESTGSEVDRQFVAAKDVKPTIAIVTSDLTALTTVGFSGLPISADGTHPGVVVYGRATALESVPAGIASTVHLSLAISDGLVVPVSLRAQHNQVAKLQLTLHAILGSGGNSGATPFVYTADQAIPTGAGATSNLYTVGPVKFTQTGDSATLLQGIQDTNITFGIEVLIEGTDGEVYPSHISIISRMTKIEFSTKDVAQVAALGDGIPISAFSAYFRQISQNGQRVAPATATHVSVSATEGMITPGATTLGVKKAGESQWTFTPSLNTNLITISATSAIPTS